MRHVSILFTAVVLLCALPGAAQSSRQGRSGPAVNVDQLIADKNYLELQKLLAQPSVLSPDDRNYVEGFMANRTNRVAESIRRLQPLVARFAVQNKQRAMVALSTLADDYEKTFRYGDAADTYARLAREFAGDMTPAELRRATREAGRWELLRGAPAQQVHRASAFTVKTVRDPAGLLEAEVTIGSQRQWMILDTGANLSVISRSTARRLGLRVSSRQTTIRGNAPGQIPVHTAIIPRLKLGTAEFRNVAVLVLEDAELDVPQLHYHIPGSLGFPVLSALGRITFLADGRFGAHLPVNGPTLQRTNLFLEKLTPIVAVGVDGTDRLFTIDTGATGSLLTAAYYREHQDDFAAQQAQDVELMGAGATASAPAYRLPVLSLAVGGGTALLRDVPVLTEPRDRFDTKFYGNLGQDVLTQFHSYSFDFRKMIFAVEPAAGSRNHRTRTGPASGW
jgi:predicted aspartyl protease